MPRYNPVSNIGPLDYLAWYETQVFENETWNLYEEFGYKDERFDFDPEKAQKRLRKRAMAMKALRELKKDGKKGRILHCELIAD
jgi:hypothetical protein